MTANHARLRELLAAASPAPWRACKDEQATENLLRARVGEEAWWVSGLNPTTNYDDENFYSRTDAELVALARNALPALLDALDEAEKALREIARYTESEWREGEKPYQLAIVAREALVRIGEK